MTPVEFAAKIHLHPCASVRVGRLTDREKATGEAKTKFSGLIPHYATGGCPLVEWNGDQPIQVGNGAQIEMHFEEDLAASFPGFDKGSYIPYNGLRKGTLLQLSYGKQGIAPTTGGYRVLREAGMLLNKLKASGKKVYLISYAWLSPGSMGAVVGRFHLLGLFSLDGEPLFIAPEAIDNGIFKAEWPADQKERSLAGSLGAQAAAQAEAGWYEDLKGVVLSINPSAKGDNLHKSILNARASQLVQRGLAPDLATAMITVTADAPSALPTAPAKPSANPAPKPAPASSRGTSGKKLMGRK